MAYFTSQRKWLCIVTCVFIVCLLPRCVSGGSLQDCKDENLSLGENHVPGVCHSFNKQQCLCELNSNCNYDAITDNCIDATDCSAYNNLAVACRAQHCNYDCTTGICGDFMSPYDSETSCHNFCYDICQCNTMVGCQLALDGSCRNVDDAACPENLPLFRKCGRQNSFYFNRGLLCKNSKQRGDCVIYETIAAVNLGGDSYFHELGIMYAADTPETYDDIHGIRKVYLTDTLDVPSEDAFLYKTVVYADSSKREDGRCLTYNISLCQNGVYELVIKTVELLDVLPGEKTFNIKLNDQYIFSELDVVRLTGKRNTGVDIILNFEVIEKNIIIEGLPPISIKNGTVTLGFCFGECIFAEGYFEIAAFAVNKIVDSLH